MDMPKSCNKCPMFDDRWDYPTCFITQKSSGYNFPIHEKRMDFCPLKEVKECEAEDCISKEAVTEVIKRWIDGRCNQTGSLMDMINRLPSVYPKSDKPSDNQVTLTFCQGTLKYSCKDYVVYKKDWLKSHYGDEIDIMFGDKQYLSDKPSGK